jgi:tight adherence protein C
MIVLTSVTGISVSGGPDPADLRRRRAGGLRDARGLRQERRTKRREVLNYLLPEGLDLLTICVEAGSASIAPSAGLARDADTMPELAREFEMTAIELTYLPDRQQALENLAERSDSAAVAALVNALRQTEKYGTPLANRFASCPRSSARPVPRRPRRRARACRRLMTVPLMVFILPTLITVLIAPAILQAINLT